MRPPRTVKPSVSSPEAGIPSRVAPALTAAADYYGAPTQVPPPSPLSERERRHALIEREAYFRAERRGFEPGHEQEDWLAAEREIDANQRDGR